ncbi:MAG: hypothetical protein HC929_22710, partial [Leptolyngbyaceae cyanobacterium SM2_5_2]|nr:hypothetical protein [Leptolyngbyaceae cyanobacterium SM2_5_2]
MPRLAFTSTQEVPALWPNLSHASDHTSFMSSIKPSGMPSTLATYTSRPPLICLP